MHFLATLTHEPADCWGRPENEGRARSWIADMPDRAERFNVDLHCAFVTPTEHTFYIVVEAEAYEAAGFLGGALLEDHEGVIAPVLPLREDGADVMFQD